MTTAIPPDEIDRRFRHHPPTSPSIAQKHEHVRKVCADLAHRLNGVLPASEEAKAAIYAVDRACQLANAAIARHCNQQSIDVDSTSRPPAAADLPELVFESAVAGASALDANARTPYGQDLLAHALARLQRDGWLREQPGPDQDAEPYVTALLDAFLTGGAVDFAEHRVPFVVVGRLTAAIEVGTFPPDRLKQDPVDIRQHTAEVPGYAWSILDALVTGAPLDFGGATIPVALADRLSLVLRADDMRDQVEDQTWA